MGPWCENTEMQATTPPINALPPRSATPFAVFFSQGFRPFFLAASIWSALALVVWMLVLLAGLQLPSRFDGLAWHQHEMMSGFVMAAVCGFLLTAIPNWTGRPPVRGVLLGTLFSLWLAGRIACVISGLIPVALGMCLDLAFPVALVGVVAREIAVSRAWRQLPMLAPVVVLGIANLLMHLEANGYSVPPGIGSRLALVAILILISVIGGRIIPNFTRNWLIRMPQVPPPPTHGKIDKAALAALHVGLLTWAFSPDAKMAAGLLAIGAVLHGVRVSRWRGWITRSEPLLLILHLGYCWLVVGVALLALSAANLGVPLPSAIHALTAGCIGTMVLAVMTRATRGHGGYPLTADRRTVVIYTLVTAAALARVVAGFGLSTVPLLGVSAILWIGAFCLFALWYGPMLLPRGAP